MEYVVYCDESRHTSPRVGDYLAIGGLWIPRSRKQDLSADLRLAAQGSAARAEVKWKKTSRVSLATYQAYIDVFFRSCACFRAIVVELARCDFDSFHGGDAELGFYKFYYEMLVKWLLPGNQYVVLLDFKQNRDSGRHKELGNVIARTPNAGEVTTVTVIDSAESRIAQLADLLTGAVAAAWSEDVRLGSPKDELVRHIAGSVGRKSLRFHSSSPAVSKLNIFRIALSEGGL